MGIHNQFAESKPCCHCINFGIIVSVLLFFFDQMGIRKISGKHVVCLYSFSLFLILVFHAIWINHQQREPFHSIKSFPFHRLTSLTTSHKLILLKNWIGAFIIPLKLYTISSINGNGPSPIGMLHRFCFVCVYYRNVRAPTFFDTFYEKWQWHREHLPICSMQMVYRVFCF